MEHYPAGQVERNEQIVPIFVTDQGEWRAEVASKWLAADTKDKLVAKIAQATKRVVIEVAVPFTELGETGGSFGQTSRVYARNGTATGFHASNGNVRVTWSDGTKAQLTDRVRRVAPLSPDEAAEYLRLATVARDAERALSAWKAAHRFDLDAAVKDAIDKA